MCSSSLGSELNLPDNVRRLINESCSKNTWNQYKNVIYRFNSFCIEISGEKNTLLKNILMYLTHLFEKNVSYSAINLARSAFSTCMDKIDGFDIGVHPLVTRLLKGVYKQRPPTAKYTCTWDANKVLNTISNFGPNSSLDLKILTLKLVGLLSLTTGQRVQTLQAIQVNNINFGSTTQIKITKHLKTSCFHREQPVLYIPRYVNEPNLCVVSCLEAYLLRTLSFRKHEQLILSILAPHKPVSSQSISRWLCQLLEKSGIDVDKFKSHSYRHSSVSKAYKEGASIDSVYKAAHWTSGSKVFAKFYNRPIVNDNLVFADSVVRSYISK